MRPLVAVVVALCVATGFAPVAGAAGPVPPRDRASVRLVPERLAVAPGAKLFSVLVRSTRARAPLVVYLAGGPGASSLAPLVLGTGPWSLQDPFRSAGPPRLVRNRWSWHRVANVVYLDQPRGVGWSADAAPYLPTVRAAGHDFMVWLAAFRRAHPDLARRPLILAGESFAGSWIAEFSRRVLRRGLPLRAVVLLAPSLGDAREQAAVPAMTELAYFCARDLVSATACDPAVPGSLHALLDRCMRAIGARGTGAVHAATARPCREYQAQIERQPSRVRFVRIPRTARFPAGLRGRRVPKPLDELLFARDSLVRRHVGFSPNPYDVTLRCRPSGGFPPWCYDDRKLTRLFAAPAIRAWLGGGLVPPGVRWRFADFFVNTVIGFPPAVPSLTAYADVLRAGVPVTVAVGRRDLDIQYPTARALVSTIARRAYGVGLPGAGGSARAGALRYVEVEAAGHLVALAAPALAQDLLRRSVAR